MTLLKRLDALRRDEPFDGFCETLRALEQNTPEVIAAIECLRRARDEAATVRAADFTDQSLKGRALGAAILAAQIERIDSMFKK